jgi:hypothetical protein
MRQQYLDHLFGEAQALAVGRHAVLEKELFTARPVALGGGRFWQAQDSVPQTFDP